MRRPLCRPVNGSERIRSSPLVRRIAKDNNLDLRQIAGTGSEGRINKEDVLRYLSARRGQRSRRGSTYFDYASRCANYFRARCSCFGCDRCAAAPQVLANWCR